MDELETDWEEAWAGGGKDRHNLSAVETVEERMCTHKTHRRKPFVIKAVG